MSDTEKMDVEEKDKKKNRYSVEYLLDNSRDKIKTRQQDQCAISFLLNDSSMEELPTRCTRPASCELRVSSMKDFLSEIPEDEQPREPDNSPQLVKHRSTGEITSFFALSNPNSNPNLVNRVMLEFSLPTPSPSFSSGCGERDTARKCKSSSDMKTW
eukprot:CAMPEP_0174260896 /NCGR_PEP_ID=MMETSP0439-20130205/10935_1 /TAXON_ID=0 /ORGANISM="Stereomyxa ramosa, Strain Chinc5" /LENGTH=156 /DNA_ID=CAMNT_0015345269 /DNA_START=392 /DNA_END=859 /DNA_ORIENTATION=-